MIVAGLLTSPAPAHAAWGSFWDDDGSTHEPYIEAIAAAGITTGCGDGRFCPDDPVTRGQMAAFLRRALEGRIRAGAPQAFSDVGGSSFAADIAWLSATGITKGCGAGLFCPDDPVTREQMASFLARALGLDPIAPRPNFANGIRVRGNDDLAEMVRSRPAGTTFVLETGVHHMTEKVVPKDGMVFVGEPGAVMDGGRRTDAAFSNGGSNVTIQGLIIQNYDTPPQRGAVEAAGAGWRVIGNEIHHNAAAGLSLGGDGFVVDGNHIHHNNQIGIIGQNARGARVVNNVIAYNNPNDRFDFGWESGGTKFLRTTNLYVANNNVHHNHGPGLWTDHDNYNTTYTNNTVRDNYGPGILHEISYDATINDNTVTGNAHRFYVAGILIASSPNVEVHGNTLADNDGGIIGLQDDRGSGSRGTYQTTNLDVHDNNVTWNTGFHGIQINAGPNIIQTNTITYDHNTYTTNQNQPFKWGEVTQTWQQWQDIGQDLAGTLG